MPPGDVWLLPVRLADYLCLFFFISAKKHRAGSGRRHDRGLHGAQRLHRDGGRGGEDAGLAYIGEVRRVLRRTNFFGLRHTLELEVLLRWKGVSVSKKGNVANRSYCTNNLQREDRKR